MSPLDEKARPRTGPHRLYLPWIVVVVGLIASTTAFVVVRRQEQSNIADEFQRRAQSTAYLIEEALKTQEEALHSLRDIFHHSDLVTSSEFENISRELMKRHNGVRSLKWAPRISAARRAQYEETMRGVAGPDFRILETRDGSLQPAAERAEYFPLTFDVGSSKNVQPPGLDLASCAAWNDFIASAGEGALRASGRDPCGTTDASAASTGYWMELPVYVAAVPPEKQQRLAELRGFVLCVFDPAVLVDTTMTQMLRSGIDILIAERLGPETSQVLHFRPSTMGRGNLGTEPDAGAMAAGTHHRVTLPFAGRAWDLWFRPAPEWIRSERTHQDVTVLLCGLFSTFALGAWVRLLVRRSLRIEELVGERTAELTRIQHELRNDIRRRVETEHALKASEERYQTFVSQSSDAVWRLELPQPIPISLPIEEQIDRIIATGFVAECNEITARLYGCEGPSTVLSKRLSELQAPGSRRHDAVLRAFVDCGYRLSEHEEDETVPGGQPRVFVHNLIGVLDASRLVRIWVTEKDITQHKLVEQEKKSFERRLNETQRLESLGVLAGGIAHDFNNLLTGILGHASLAHAELTADSPLNAHLEQIENASRSAASLCQQMLAYAGKGRFVIKRHNLSQIVSQTAHLLQVSIGKKAELRFRLTEPLPPVMADATQLQQIVMNLVINAAEAINSHNGLITLATGVISPNATTFAGCPYSPDKLAASYVYLEVRDNGQGMTPEVRARIFEPFFTTKFSGRGLGLAAALGIVRGHAGALRVESTQNEGSVFTLFLPVVSTAEAEVPATAGTNSPWNSDGTLLIIDDEAPVREVAKRMAQTLGFKALTADDGARGIDLFRQSSPGIGIVLLDVTMPGMTGEETLSKLREISPNVHVVLMSGYNRPDNIPLSASGSPPVFLSKPFTIGQFQTALRRASKQS